MPLLSPSFCEMSHGPMPKTLIDINQLKDSKSRAQQHSSHLSQQRRGYSELRQKIRAKPQPTPRTAALMTARLTILPHQSSSQKTAFPRLFTLVTDLALKAQPPSACSTVMAAVVFESQTCSKTGCLLSVCGSRTEALALINQSEDVSVSSVSKPALPHLPPSFLPSLHGTGCPGML